MLSKSDLLMSSEKSSEESGIIKEGHTVKGIARTMGHIIDPSLTWEDLKWIRSITSLPLVLKGIQCVEDAILAYEHGVQGIVLSNHGGRSQDTYVFFCFFSSISMFTSAVAVPSCMN
jgi:isopentenyl diphosphate isomerase/L-lactate dehydrogenase-like FMN-dependent dehydrogenase